MLNKVQAPACQRPNLTIHPDLLRALRELAEVEEYSVSGLATLLIRDALDRRLHQNGGGV
jgi:hypothetical protein